MHLASSRDTVRFRPGTNIIPNKSAPASAAITPASGVLIPQILTKTSDVDVTGVGNPNNSAIKDFVSFARINDSPTSTAPTPSPIYFCTSFLVEIPLNAHNIVPLGTSETNFDVVSKSTEKECKFRLFTPMTFAPRATATCSSSAEATSTSGSIPNDKLYEYNFSSCEVVNIATIRRIVSAPANLASRI